MDDYDILKPMMTRGSPLCLKNPPIIDHCYGDPAFYYHCYYEYHIIINIIIIMIYYGTLVLYISYIYISYIYIIFDQKPLPGTLPLPVARQESWVSANFSPAHPAPTPRCQAGDSRVENKIYHAGISRIPEVNGGL